MSSKDPFQQSRELTEQLREDLRDIRRDVQAIVEDEVRRAADPGRMEALVREAVRRELSQRTPWLVANAVWVAPVFGALVGLALGLSAFAFLAARNPAEQAAPTVVAASNPPSAAATPATQRPTDPATLAARYDSLFAARSPAFDPLLGTVETATPNPVVRAAIVSWRQGAMTQAHRDRLHSAFVQLALRDAVDPGVALDGGILRDPCRGTSCGALLRLWRDSGDQLGLPPYHPGVASDSAAVRVAERVLVLDRLQGAR